MELYIYKCPKCGFTHQLPAYWVDFNPHDTFEYEHPNLKKGEICENLILEFQGKNI